MHVRERNECRKQSTICKGCGTAEGVDASVGICTRCAEWGMDLVLAADPDALGPDRLRKVG